MRHLDLFEDSECATRCARDGQQHWAGFSTRTTIVYTGGAAMGTNCVIVISLLGNNVEMFHSAAQGRRRSRGETSREQTGEKEKLSSALGSMNLSCAFKIILIFGVFFLRRTLFPPHFLNVTLVLFHFPLQFCLFKSFLLSQEGRSFHPFHPPQPGIFQHLPAPKLLSLLI